MMQEQKLDWDPESRTTLNMMRLFCDTVEAMSDPRATKTFVTLFGDALAVVDDPEVVSTLERTTRIVLGDNPSPVELAAAAKAMIAATVYVAFDAPRLEPTIRMLMLTAMHMLHTLEIPTLPVYEALAELAREGHSVVAIFEGAPDDASELFKDNEGNRTDDHNRE